MTAFVLDASVAMAWCFGDEATAASKHLLDELEAEEAMVPTSWHLEVANVLAVSERRNRITAARIVQFIEMIEALDIIVDQETPSRAFGQILDLARAERLTSYDVAYLELAMRLGVPLATKDRQLGQVAERLGVQVLWAT